MLKRPLIEICIYLLLLKKMVLVIALAHGFVFHIPIPRQVFALGTLDLIIFHYHAGSALIALAKEPLSIALRNSPPTSRNLL